jgi:hypothetical protein
MPDRVFSGRQGFVKNKKFPKIGFSGAWIFFPDSCGFMYGCPAGSAWDSPRVTICEGERNGHKICYAFFGIFRVVKLIGLGLRMDGGGKTRGIVNRLRRNCSVYFITCILFSTNKILLF